MLFCGLVLFNIILVFFVCIIYYLVNVKLHKLSDFKDNILDYVIHAVIKKPSSAY